MPGGIHQKPPLRSPRPRLLAAAALVSGVLIAGCGGSSRSPTAASTDAATSSASTASDRGAASSGPTPASPADSGLALSKCMRANGVPNFPDLSSDRMLIQGNTQTVSVNGISVAAPAFQAARRKCQKYLPHQQATPTQAARQRQRGLEFARCMRVHGVPNFPDPKVVSSSGSSQQVYLPGINPQSPAFQAGAKACGGGPKG